MANKWAVLASGTGSLFRATLDSCITVDRFVTDRDCPAFDIANERLIPKRMIERKQMKKADFDPVRDAYTKAMVRYLKHDGITHVAMMGFETIFSPAMFAPEAYGGFILNSHPALLPLFKGHNAPHQTIAAQNGGQIITKSGCTIHVATDKLDDGPILAQLEVPVYSEDDGDTLWERIKVQERLLWPKIIRDINVGVLQLPRAA